MPLHDAICTCSVDETLADIKNRLEGVWQIGQEVLKDDLLKIGASLNGHGEKGAEFWYTTACLSSVLEWWKASCDPL